MSDAMSFAELSKQDVELLPARTVLSLLRAGTTGANNGGANNGDPGTRGADGKSITKFAAFGIIGWGGSDPNYSSDTDDTSGSHS
jgi:hypothetical protein